MSTKKALTRREFIRHSSLAAVGSSVLLGTPLDIWPGSNDPGAKGSSSEKEIEGPSMAGMSKVVLIRNQDVLNTEGKPKFDVVLRMLDSAVSTLAGKKNPMDAWKTFIKPDDIVGIKTNVWTYIPTTSEVEQALKKRVMDVGVAESNIGIDDRGVLRNPIFQKATALINARPMRSHHWAGVGSLVKNYVMFVPDPFNYHEDSCADLAKIWNLPIVKGKTRLNVLVMLTPQFHGVGPHNFNPKYVWKYNGILVGTDPVAVDSVGLQIIQAKRKEFFKEDTPLNPPAKHIFVADTKFNLGTADPKKIKLVKLGDEKDILI